MNFITYDRAYSLYPIATYEEFEAIPFSRERESDRAVWEKYVHRGSMLQNNEPGLSSLESFSPGVERSVGDRNSWMVSLSVAELGIKTLPVSHLHHTWSLRDRVNGDGFFIELAACREAS